MQQESKGPAFWIEKFRNLQRSTQITFGLGLIAVIILITVAVLGPTSYETNSMLATGIDVALKLGIVILLIYLSAFILKRFGVSGYQPKKKRLQVKETLALSTKRLLHIIEIDDKELLI